MDFRIFPTNSCAQFVIDGKAFGKFPSLAGFGDDMDSGGTSTNGAAGDVFLRENVLYCAMALVPEDANGRLGGKTAVCEDGDDNNGGYCPVVFVCFSTNVTIEVLDEALALFAKSSFPEFGDMVCSREVLPDGFLKLAVTNSAPTEAKGANEGDGDLPRDIYFVCADSTLAVASNRKPLVRRIADDIRAGCVFCPEIPAKHPLFWLSTVINPNEIFGGDKGDGDDGDADADEEGDDEASVLETMPFLRDLSRITATAEGVSEDESVRVVASAKFTSPQGAAAAATALRPFLAFLPQAGDDSLAQLAARAIIDTSGDECRVTLTFSREDIGRLVDSATAL